MRLGMQPQVPRHKAEAAELAFTPPFTYAEMYWEEGLVQR